MESGNCAGITLDVSFGFDNPKFYDGTLLLEIIDDAVDRSHRLPNKKGRRSDDLLNKEPLQRLKTIHITSLILAARSPYFFKLFSNGMQESKQKLVTTLQIEASDEVSFMDLLKYIYSNNLPTSLDALLDLLMIADKFEVESCSKDCTQALQNMTMTCELASVFVNLPTSLPIFSTLHPLIEDSGNFLVAKFNDLSKYKEELINLSLSSLEVLLSRDDLQVTSEYDVYEFVLTWAHKHYPDSEGRRDILQTCLLQLIRFPFMNKTQLTEKVQTCSDIDPEFASKIVHQALCFKDETDSLQRHCRVVKVEGSAECRKFVKRAYINRPVKVDELESSSHPQCIVYLDLTRNELKCTTPLGDSIYSEAFHLGGQELKLRVQRSVNDKLNFWLFRDKSKSSSSECTIKYEFAAKKKPEERFEEWRRGSHKSEGTAYKCIHFIGDEQSSYFINDILHLRAKLTVEKKVENK